MNTLVDIQQDWQQQLATLYPEREINVLLRFMVEDLFGWSYSRQLDAKHELLPADMISRLAEAGERLRKGEPLQYITGFTYFDELKIRVSPAVLIPRPETEELVHWIAESLSPDFNGTIVDWCTGSGCIALALKNRFPHATVIGYDLSETALEIARQNASELQLDVLFEAKDALTDDSELPVDIIVSNPPYIPEQDAAEMHENVLEHEPHMALFVPDSDALIFYRSITEKALRTLRPGGDLYFELHERYADETKQLVLDTNNFQSVEIRNDLQGKARMLKALKSK